MASQVAKTIRREQKLLSPIGDAIAGYQFGTLKLVQARLGHAGIQMTADTYGHLFPRGDDGAELAAAEKAFDQSVPLESTPAPRLCGSAGPSKGGRGSGNSGIGP
jgi:hypothetical protein